MQADDGSITGVKTDKGDYSAKAVILAAGGLGSNPDMITKYRPDLEGMFPPISLALQVMATQWPKRLAHN